MPAKNYDKKAELTPGLAHYKATTWRLILNLDSSAAIECLTCAATYTAPTCAATDGRTDDNLPW